MLTPKMKKTILFSCLLLSAGSKLFSAPIDLLSPDKKIKIAIDPKNKISYAVTFNGDALLSDSYLQLNLDNQKMGEMPQFVKKAYFTINTASDPVVPLTSI
jgi:alpha-glucosidase